MSSTTVAVHVDSDLERQLKTGISDLEREIRVTLSGVLDELHLAYDFLPENPESYRSAMDAAQAGLGDVMNSLVESQRALEDVAALVNSDMSMPLRQCWYGRDDLLGPRRELETLRDTDTSAEQLRSQLEVTIGLLRDARSSMLLNLMNIKSLPPLAESPDQGVASSSGSTLTVLPSAANSTSSRQEMMFGVDSAHTGVYPGGGPDEPNTVLWKIDTEDAVGSPPVVFDEAIYVGTMGGVLLAVDAKTGKEKWRYETAPASLILSSPAVSSDTVYLSATDDYLYALDRKSGKERWSFKTGDESISSPVLADGMVYVGSHDGYVYALNAQDGREKWSFKTNHWVNASPAVHKGMVFFGSADGNFYAVDAYTGQQRWKVNLGTGSTTVTVSDETVFLTTADDCAYALDASSGATNWRVETEGTISGCAHPATANGAVYFATEDGLDTYLYALDKATGRERWKTPTKAGILGDASPAISGTSLYLGCGDGSLRVFDTETGSQKARFVTGSDLLGSLTSAVVSDGVVFFGAFDHYLYAIN